MRFRIRLLLLCSVVSLGVSSCAARKAAINQPSLALQTQGAVFEAIDTGGGSLSLAHPRLMYLHAYGVLGV
jgi:hypothetical protein